ncbi:MAG: glycosyltransferase, partial [Pseudomonadota bacterium]
GNSADFHAGLLRLARRMPAVIVLHDVAVQELIHEAIRRGHFPVDQYRASMARWYGPDGLEAADAVLAQQGSAHALSRRFPGFEIICEQAVSVITHSRAAHDLVAARKLWPVYNLPLPFAVPDTPPALAPAQSGPLRLVQFGYLGENRQIDVVLDALASLRDQIAFRFDIIGDLLLPDYVKAAIADRDLEDRVHLHGFVSEAALDARVRQAHLVFNLRYPTMGEASGSQLRIWANGVASVVTDHGWYADIPDGTAFKVPVGGERAVLEDILRNLDADRSAGVDMARAGHQHFRDHHSPAQYAQALAKVWDMYPQDAQHSYLQARRARFDGVPS